ncbi:MAG: GNAT family N-acetyltransferase [Psychrosphaera sp.]|nr:GNAT family N-acetyltransferase [Psychrosphaera sp.]
MQILQTERLSLHHATEQDAAFIYDLLTDQTFIDNIADKGVKNLDDARAYINDSLINSYNTHGFGLFLTKLKSDGTPIGLCGLLKRDDFDCPDVGYAFLPKYTGQGYATEAAKGAMVWGKETLGIKRIIAITMPGNKGSIKVLEKLGLVSNKTIDFMDSENLLFEPV